ncbi:hypothetical protein [Streptomyces sp. V3I7]|uniref:hypothetical protein n=1 Tax=Streptomyces sp. V3I7 TaxID=3042278 RepID=UPI00277F76CA|nr:hypothetical protein [Streptomyces sp. V3I7]MDQ0989653.1 YD repeat-containing protein [Streptomyces sp. V3I7]
MQHASRVVDVLRAQPEHFALTEPTSQTDHDGNPVSWADNVADSQRRLQRPRVTSLTAVGGGATPAGLVASQRTPDGALTSYRYYANGDTAQVTSPAGLITSYTYDGLGRKTSETQVSSTFPNGVTTTYSYDTASHVVTETGAGVKDEITNTSHTAEITRSYDEDGNQLSETTKDTTGGDTERTITYHYDTHGLNDSVTDAEQNTTTYDHDAFGRVNGMTDATRNAILAHEHFTRLSAGPAPGPAHQLVR